MDCTPADLLVRRAETVRTADAGTDGSNRLVDAIITWGTLDTIAKRLDDHRSAGADHICIQVIPTAHRDIPRQAWKELAALLPS